MKKRAAASEGQNGAGQSAGAKHHKRSIRRRKHQEGDAKQEQGANGRKCSANGRENGANCQKHGTLENLLYWLKSLYREAPGLVWLYGAAVAASVALSLLGVYMPSVLVADITRGDKVEKILLDLAVLGGGLVLLYLFSCWAERTKPLLSSRMEHRQALRLARLSLDADYGAIERADFPTMYWNLLDRHMWQGEYSSRFLGAFASSAAAVIGMILYVGMLSGLSLWILLLVIGGTAVNYWVGIRCNKWDAANRHKWMSLDQRMFYLSRSTSTYEASKDVHVYGMPSWLRQKFDSELKQRLKYTARMQANYYLESAAGGLTQMIWEGAAYLYLIYLVCEGRLDAAGFVLYFGVITGFASWCRSIVSGMRELHKSASYVEEERSFAERLQKGGDEEKEDLVLPEGHVPEITFDNVTFWYPGADEPTIKNLSLRLGPGENIALVGLNGAGKTTFVKLLCGFYDPTEGRILVDGVDRSGYSKGSWLKFFSGVFQDAELLPLSLRENLTLGETVSEEQIQESLRMADLDEKVQKLTGKFSDGMDVMFGKGSYEDAVDLSGGEKQKLMLARALCKQAPLLVLDEPTAALDPLVESQLYERYRKFSEGRTTVFISHRLASTRFCDRILLMEDGEAVETGTHEELLAADGKYAWMFQVQSRYYQKKEAQREAGLEGEEVEA